MATLKWVFTEGVLPWSVLKSKSRNGWTLLDYTISWGYLEITQFLFEKGGRPNLKQYCDGKDNSVHYAARHGHTAILQWVFTENVLPLRVLNIKGNRLTPLEYAILERRRKTVILLRKLFRKLSIVFVFLAMQRAKHDYHQCVLRRLPDELLDMVVDEVAARFRLKVEW